MPTRSTLCSWIAILGAMGSEALCGAAPPATVSPGRMEHWALVEGRCPSFSWTLVPQATTLELAVFAVSSKEEAAALDLDQSELVLLERLPGATSSWTPSLDRCLEPGARYAWFVRGVFDDAADRTPRISEWSRGRLFEVSARPSLEEVELALDVLQRHRAAESSASVAESHMAVEQRAPSDASSATGEGARRPARVSQSTATGPRLRVEGMISGDGSELTSVDAETLDGLDSTDLASSATAPLSLSSAVLSLTPCPLATPLLVSTGTAFQCALASAATVLDNSLGSDDLATDSVKNKEIAADAVELSDISGTEVGLYVQAAGCAGGGSFTLDPTCLTPICNFPLGYFFDCAGACPPFNEDPDTCNNSLLGYLLSPVIP